MIKLRSWAGVRLTTKNGSRLRKLIQNWLHCSLGRKRSRAGRNFQGTESKLLHIVMFVGELFCFPQLLKGLVNVIHGGSSVPTPIAASMLQIVPGTMECSPCGFNFGGHVPLRGSWEKGSRWGSRSSAQGLRG